MLTAQSKAVPTFGYRLFIQLILFNRPEAVIGYRDMYLDLLQQNVNRPIRSLSILWSVGQAGQTNLANGLKVWLGIMLPVMNVRSLSNYCVLYLENLFRLHTNLKSGYEGLPKKDFFKLFDELFSLQSSLSTDLRKRLQALYPKLKAVAWGAQSESTLHNLFSSFLMRCVPDAHASKKAELLDCLVQCLEIDSQSFSVWRQVYVKHLLQSSVLLQYISDNLGSRSISQKLLLETVRAFHLTNEEMAGGPDTHTHHYKTCVSSCQALLTRLSAPRLPWRRVLGLVLLVLVAVFVCDVYVSGGLHKSQSYRTLNDLGIIAVLQHAWLRLYFYLTKACQWLVVNVPYYYHKTAEIVSPYVLLIWEKLCQAATWTMACVQPLTDYIKALVPVAQQWLEKTLPPVLEVISYYVDLAFTYLIGGTIWLLSHLLRVCVVIRDWLLLNVLVGSFTPDNILRTLSSGLVHIQSCCYSFYSWCASFIV
jgi:hypothetical protein